MSSLVWRHITSIISMKHGSGPVSWTQKWGLTNDTVADSTQSRESTYRAL